jgi:hypothetical protein
MKKILCLALLMLSTFGASATTWVVRADGGTRFSVNVSTGQCNGMADAPYSGTGTNQPCGFNDVRYLWTDGTYTTSPTAGNPKWGWIGASGDTYLIRGGPWRIGQAANGNNQGFGIQGDPYANTPIPPNNVTIEGENFANCTVNAKTRTVGNATQLFGGFATTSVLDLSGTTGVKVQCLELTDHGSCVFWGSGNQCSKNYPLSDYAQNGIQTSNKTTNLSVTNVVIHGFVNTGWFGPTGNGTVLTNIGWWGNVGANVNMDLGDGTTGTGTLAVNHFYCGWSGFSEEYPIIDPLPFFNGLDQNSGGYGDCFGTATAVSSPAWLLSFNYGIFEYSTQDGLDCLHCNGGGTKLTVNAVIASGNMGNQIKDGSQSTITNSQINANCTALQQTIPGTPAGFNKQLSLWCRAGNEAMLIAVNDGNTTTVANNTIIGTGSGDLGGVVCNSACTAGTAALVYENNIQIGYSGITRFTDGTGTKAGVFSQLGSKISNNFCFGAANCKQTGEVNLSTASPQLVDITYHPYGYGNIAPTSATSNVVGYGLPIAGLTTDLNGNPRPSPPSAGAVDWAGATPTPVIPTTPTITWNNPASIVSGTPLSATQLNATSSTTGTFTYTPPVGTVLPVGSSLLTVLFTPSDLVHFTTATKNVPITVTAVVPPPSVLPVTCTISGTITVSTTGVVTISPLVCK